MRTFLSILVVTLLANAARADDAKSAFDAQDYAGAARRLGPALIAHGPTAEGYANLALANQKAGDTTQAALNYERALRLDPGLETAKNALAQLAAAQKFPLPPRTWKDDVTAVVHPEALVIAGAALVWIGAFGLVFAAHRARRRAGTTALAALALLAGVAAFAAGWLTDPRLAPGRPAMVRAKDGADILTAPTNNSPAILSLPAGAPVEVLSPRGAWTYVNLAGGARGWMQSDRLTPLVPGENF